MNSKPTKKHNTVQEEQTNIIWWSILKRLIKKSFLWSSLPCTQKSHKNNLHFFVKSIEVFQSGDYQSIYKFNLLWTLTHMPWYFWASFSAVLHKMSLFLALVVLTLQVNSTWWNILVFHASYRNISFATTNFECSVWRKQLNAATN